MPMILKRSKSLVFLIGFFSFIVPFAAGAAVSELEINYDPAAFTAPATLSVATSSPESMAASLPWEWQALTTIYEYSFATNGFYDPSRPLQIKISYPDADKYYKQIFIYDAWSKVWRPIPTADEPETGYVTATTDSTAGRLILLSNPDLMTVGSASWYAFKNGLFAASPDFAKGSVLRVHNLANGKSVDVTVNDWGPDRGLHPDRVIDLDKVAFSRIASPAAGLISVKVEPLKIVVPESKKAVPQSTGELTLTASSAVLVWEKNGQVLWGKDEEKVSPLASLTKLVAAKIFMETKPDLKKVVSYKKADEEYNNKYCPPGESARLRVKDGETMTIEDLLYSALVGSANNAVESLVRVSGLNRAAFIARMNEAVKKWGASSTRFIEPSGLSPDNVSSPLDYAIITKEVFTDALLKKISTTQRYTFKTRNTKKAHTLTNTNQLLKTNTYPIIGSKTGYLDEAGYCLMTRVATAQGNLIAINFGSTSKANNFLDNEQIIRFGQRLLQNLLAKDK
ncbi:MAG: RlpA-like double-psi beta-barrel domain-containing protein [Patescibacteria group bacterium]